MKRFLFSAGIVLCLLSCAQTKEKAHNPVIYADVPDISVIRVGENYYMSSTTMHMSPGVPIMKSNDLVNWELVNYAYDTLAQVDALNLENGENAYGSGSWASCLRYHQGKYYVSTFAGTTGSTYIYTTDDIENGPWEVHTFKPAYHDHSIFYDEDGHIYMIYGCSQLHIVEIKTDLSGIVPGTDRVLIENASAPAGNNIGLGAEGSQLFKKDGKYYLFNITWPRGGMRTVVVHRADSIQGPYEGKVVLQDKGVAQGGMVDMPDGRWFAYLFRDYGSVGRIPYMVPMTWEDGWPVLGIHGIVPDSLDLPANKSLIPHIVNSDEFNRKQNEKDLPLVWQWNHNPDNSLWSVSERKGYLRLHTGRIDSMFLMAKNTLTQRTIGPVCSAEIKIDANGMKEGDFAGLALLQRQFGQVGITKEGDKFYIVMVSGEDRRPIEIERVPVDQEIVYFKASCDFTDLKDVGYFYYSIDGKSWTPIGRPIKMRYSIPHFMGYRFGLFQYATQTVGGYADFDYFHINENL